MEIVFLRFMDGKNIYSNEKVIDFLVKNISKEEANLIYNSYEFINKELGIMDKNLNFKYEDNKARMFFTYTYKFISKYIIESLASGIESNKIIINGKRIVDNSFEKSIVDNFCKKNIPYYFIDEETVQIGYGSKSIVAKKLEDIPSDLSNVRIPIITITGSNGKTTTARLIYLILSKLGYRCGLTCTGGIYINGNKIRSGDTTGYYSAKEILNNKEVDIAILEVARGGIVKNGLAYDKSNIAIITTISDDHVGMEGAKSINDLVDIKMLTTKTVDDNGLIIAKVEPILVDKLNRENIIFFDYEDNELLHNLQRKYETYNVEEHKIVKTYKQNKEKICDINEINFAYGGASKSNIKNIICAFIASYRIHKNSEEILKIIKSLECNNKQNIGRQNIFSYNNAKVLVDYGHNEEALLEIYDLVKAIKGDGKVITIIGAPGDRQNCQIIKLGKIAAKNSDYIIVKELKNTRGRISGECANLLLYGINKVKFNSNNIITIMDEKEALEYGLRIIEENDVLIYFVQDEGNIEYAIKLLN